MRLRTSTRWATLASVALGTVLTTTTAPAHAAATTHVKVIAACAKAVYKPGHYIFTCADAGIGLNHASYDWWTEKTAHGTGTYYFNDCRPDCASGTVHHQHAEFSLYRVRNTDAHGRLFTRIGITTRKGHHVYQLPTTTI